MTDGGDQRGVDEWYPVRPWPFESEAAAAEAVAELHTLPPGLERRQLMDKLGINISPDDFTPEEWAQIAAIAAAGRRPRRNGGSGTTLS